MQIERNFINEKYLQELSKKCRESLKKDYKLSRFEFGDFEIINAFLINKVIFDNKFNLLINTLDKEEKSKLYVPAILIASIFSFYKNYTGYSHLPVVGDIVQERGLRYKVIEITEDKKYKLQSIDKNKTSRYLDEETVKTFFITTGNLAPRIQKRKFDVYRNLFESIFPGVDGKLPSKFEYKSVIVAKKEIISELKDFKVNSQKIYNAIPFKYLSKKGTPKKNLPIDPMIYIVNDYETVREFIFNKDDVKVDTIIFIGETKYKDSQESISTDFRREKFNNVIFIGRSDIDSFLNLHKWNWTLPELEKLNSIEPAPVDVVEVKNESLSRFLKDFDDSVKRIESDFSIELNEIYRGPRKLFPIIVPYPESRMKRQISSHRVTFEQECKEILEEQFYRINEDYGASFSQLKECFNRILNALNDGRGKMEQLPKSKKFSLVVPKDMIQNWEEDIVEDGLRKAKIISYEDFKKLPEDSPKKVFFLALYGYEFFKTILNSHHRISLLLYKEEKKRFDDYLQRFKRELETELSSSDRKKLCGIDYPKDMMEEGISDLIERHYHSDMENSINDSIAGQTVCIEYKLTFEDGESKVLDSNKSVILLQGGAKRVERISNLIEGDEIRIYENTTKEQLYDIAIKEDKEGRFQQIEEDSKIWKLFLKKFCEKTCGGDSKRLFELLKKKGLALKSEITLERWISNQDREKFPASIRNLIAIKNTINRPELEEKFESIKRSRKSYRSIMIALGKDMSSEIMEYIISGIKGKILAKFSDAQITKFMVSNAPKRRIKEIEIVEDYDGSE